MIWQQIEREIDWSAARSRGPGGQNVNKVASAALLTWDFSASSALSEEEKFLVREKLARRISQDQFLYLRSDESRDFPRNKQRCLEKLRELLNQALHRPKPRRATKPTRASKVRRKEGKRRRGEIKKMRGRVREE